MTMNESSVSRRTFVKGSLAGLALAGAAGSTALYGCAPKDEKGAASEGAGASPDQISWSQCNVNCGGNCVFQWHSQDGKIVYMEAVNPGDVDLQARACLRGRSMRRWINSPDRLTKPMKRVGKRGEGKFEEISWDEAIDTIDSELKRVIDTYGNDAIYVNCATGMYSPPAISRACACWACWAATSTRRTTTPPTCCRWRCPSCTAASAARTTTCTLPRSPRPSAPPTLW